MREFRCFVCDKRSKTSDNRVNRGKFCSWSCYITYKKVHMRGIPIARPPLKFNVKIPSEKWKMAYLAGLIDGEGSIMFTKNKMNCYGKQPRVCVYNTDLKMLNWIKTNFEGTITRVTGKKSIYNHLKPEYVWSLRSYRDILVLLNHVLQFLITKRQKCIEIIGFCSMAIINHEIRQVASSKTV